VPVTDREVELVEVLMRELTGVDLSELHDQYRHALEALVDAKLAGEKVEAPPAPPPAVDLMAALEESVREARARRGENP
jgi:DNA end-binding protein Ku